MSPGDIDRLAWATILLPVAGAAAVTPNPRTAGAIIGLLVARWTGTGITLAAGALTRRSRESTGTTGKDGCGSR